MKIMVTGATGFVGSYIVDRLLEFGHTVRCLVRSPVNAQGLASNGVELLEGDVRDFASVARAAEGMDAVIHLVGIIREKPGATFEAIHVEGTKNVVLALKEKGIRRLVHMSALGVRPEARSRYHQTKWQAEQVVKESGLDFTILRPSIIFGKGDGFTSKILDLVCRAPLIPIIGSGRTPYQPVWVEDVSYCFVASLDNDEAIGQTYELCGPEVITFEQYVNLTMHTLGIHKPKAHIPVGLMSWMVSVMPAFLPNPPITRDELLMSQEDNTCSSSAMIDIYCRTPARLSDVIRDILRLS